MEYIIDVRTPEEFEKGHYTDAINHELALLEDDLMPEYPKDAELFVYCKRGIRAGKAQKILQEHGFLNVTNIGAYDPDIDPLG